ncbi:MAG: glycosyltransferase family 39 protein, partial [Thermoanaerobaculia bacterium]|nr:glycosyltransferase family 39 protein [Thermoanaerobaculia bacterium]
MSPPRMTRDDALLLAGAFALALAVRLLSLPAATDGGLRLASPDSYGHLRRATAVARSFPRVPVRDAWLNHPDGGVFIWPPAFDLVAGGVARLAYGRDATQAEVARVLAALPPLFGALHVVPLFFLARRVLSRRRAALAAAAYALVPAAAIWSQFGHGDHHVAEVLLLLFLLLALARTREAGLPARTEQLRAFLAGGALAAMVLTWQGAVFAAALAFLWAALALRPRSACLFALSATGLTALGTLPYAAGLDLPFTFVSFGWFQPALLLAGSAAVAAVGAVRAAGRARLAFAGLALFLAAAAAPLSSPLASTVLRGSRYVATHAAGSAADEMDRGGYLSYPKDLLAVIAEARPLLKPPFASTLKSAIEELSPGLVLLPVAVILWIRRRADRRLLALFGGALLVMTLSQQRNVYYLAPFAALALAETLARLAPQGRLRALPAALAASALLVALPGLPHYGRIVKYSGAPGTDLAETLERFRRLAPPPADPADLPQPLPGTLPGFFAPWSAGHFVTALTGYPAAADPFGYGWRRQARLFTATDDAEAGRILSESRCAWLFTTNLRPVLPAYAAAAGRPGVPPAATFTV